MATESTLPVTIDKSHLITIGEKLYSSSLELVRELVNNAFDADAGDVKVTIGDDRIEVVDNGSGMDLKGLKQYFKIGSPEKLVHSKSPIFKRARIGQFGIGKFATLSACERFEVHTQKGDFAARVVFDKTLWQEIEADWHLPLEIIEADTERGDGTTVVLSRLFKKLDIDLVQQKIMESVPLAGKKTGTVAKRAMREALERIAKALTRHPDLSPFGATPLAGDASAGNEAAAEIKEPKSPAVTAKEAAEPKAAEQDKQAEQAPKAKKAAVEQLTPNAVVQKLKMGGSQVSCCIDSFGPEGPEVFTEGTIIYINRDHPLYQREVRKKETHTLNLARLITQEISMMKDGVGPREAYDHQSILLKDAFAD